MFQLFRIQMRRHFCEHILDDFFYHNKPLLYTDIVKDRGFLCQLLTQLYSDLSAYATNAQLQSTFINISNKRYVKITASENNSNYGIIFAVTSQGILCVYSVNGNFTTLFESTGNRVKISASGLVTTIDCAASYTHGFILRGGSLKNMPYEIS